MKKTRSRTQKNWFTFTLLVFLVFTNCNFIYKQLPENNNFSSNINSLSENWDEFEDSPAPEIIEETEIVPSSNDLAIEEPTPFSVETEIDGFAYKVSVFGVSIFASENIQVEKISHAANILAQYLDNDEDGIPDNPAVIEQLVENQAAILMFADERDEESFDIDYFLQKHHDNGITLLYGFETFPEGSSYGAFDASLEEILHLITQFGYAQSYPEIWGEQPGSAVADVMDQARGGQFMQIPSQYPASAWFTYDDPTCEYDCQIAEYTYWALTSLLGAQQYPGRLEEIEHEWQLNTPDKLQEFDPEIYTLLTDPDYNFPTILPDGTYEGFELSTNKFP